METTPFIADCTREAEARRRRRQDEEDLWAGFFGRAPRNFLHVGPHPLGCEEALADVPVEPSLLGPAPVESYENH